VPQELGLADHGFDLIRPDINCASGAEIAVTVIE